MSAADEFRVVRQAIADRGNTRSALMLAGLVGWAATLTATLAVLPYPVAAAVPLTVLLGTLEVIRPIHFGAERIGRYLQVFHEEADGDAGPMTAPAWERAAMALGAPVPGAAGHPLYVPVFALATLVNFLAVVLPGPLAVETASMAVPHAALLVWILRADRAVRAQRTQELQRFRALRDTAPRR